jgi:hypothetical protein
MEKNNSFEASIKSALAFGEDKIELNTAYLKNVKLNLKMIKERKNFNMTGIKLFLNSQIKKAVIVVCTLAIIMAASITFIQPVKAFADNVKAMIYDVVKGDDGKYVAIKIPNEETKTQTVTGKLPTIETSNTSSANSKMPSTLTGGYQLYDQSETAYNPNGSNIIAVSTKQETKLSLKLPAGWLPGASFWYRKASSVIIASENDYDCPQVINSKGEAVKGDNQKELTISGQSVVYAEYPDARYPYVKDTEDRTQAPSIHVSHTLLWNNNGKYYTLYDFNGDLTLDILKEAATSVIDSLK